MAVTRYAVPGSSASGIQQISSVPYSSVLVAPAWSTPAPGLLGVTSQRIYAEERPRLLGVFEHKSLLGLGRVVVAPQPDHLFGKFGRAVTRIVRTFSKAEMKIVIFQFEGVGEANISCGPAPVVG